MKRGEFVRDREKSSTTQKAVFKGLEGEWIRVCEMLKRSGRDLSRIKICLEDQRITQKRSWS